MKPIANFAFFSSEIGVLRHFWQQNSAEMLHNGEPDDQQWLTKMVAQLCTMFCVETLREFHRRFVAWYGEDYIVTMPLDLKFLKGATNENVQVECSQEQIVSRTARSYIDQQVQVIIR